MFLYFSITQLNLYFSPHFTRRVKTLSVWGYIFVLGHKGLWRGGEAGHLVFSHLSTRASAETIITSSDLGHRPCRWLLNCPSSYPLSPFKASHSALPRPSQQHGGHSLALNPCCGMGNFVRLFLQPCLPRHAPNPFL